MVISSLGYLYKFLGFASKLYWYPTSIYHRISHTYIHCNKQHCHKHNKGIPRWEHITKIAKIVQCSLVSSYIWLYYISAGLYKITNPLLVHQKDISTPISLLIAMYLTVSMTIIKAVIDYSVISYIFRVKMIKKWQPFCISSKIESHWCSLMIP